MFLTKDNRKYMTEVRSKVAQITTLLKVVTKLLKSVPYYKTNFLVNSYNFSKSIISKNDCCLFRSDRTVCHSVGSLFSISFEMISASILAFFKIALASITTNKCIYMLELLNFFKNLGYIPYT